MGADVCVGEPVSFGSTAVGIGTSSSQRSAIQPGLRVSVSVGLACARGPAGVDDIYPRADAALYAAKAAGSGLQRIAH